MPTHNYNANGDVLDPNEPIVSAYTTALTSAGGAYGFASAAELQNLLYTVNNLLSTLLTKQVISAS